jgi:uncharacterized protein VirK/YbjX
MGFGPSAGSVLKRRPHRIGLSSFWSACTGPTTAGAFGRIRRRTRFLLRALGQPRLTRAWLARLVQPDIAPLFAARPRLALKIQRPYVCCAWGASVRFAALLRHYDILCRLVGPEARDSIYRNGIDLVRLAHLGNGGTWMVQLFYHDRFEKEGELTLAVRETTSGVMLAGITFCLTENSDERIAIIGGVQAGADPRTLSLIHDSAKAMHGMRPKALALWCLQQMAGPFGFSQIQAVGDGQHVWRHWHHRVDIAACYDDFWRESDGRSLPGGGNWEIPVAYHVRSRSELKPSRRKIYERRYAMLSALRPRLLEAFARLTPGGGGGGSHWDVPLEFAWPDAKQGGEEAADSAEGRDGGQTTQHGYPDDIPSASNGCATTQAA